MNIHAQFQTEHIWEEGINRFRPMSVTVVLVEAPSLCEDSVTGYAVLNSLMNTETRLIYKHLYW